MKAQNDQNKVKNERVNYQAERLEPFQIYGKALLFASLIILFVGSGLELKILESSVFMTLAIVSCLFIAFVIKRIKKK